MKENELKINDFELIPKSHQGNIINDNDVAIGKATIRLGKGFLYCKDFSGLEIWYSKNKKILGLRPSNNPIGYSFRKKGNILAIGFGKLSTILKDVPKGRFPAQFNDKLKMILIYFK